MIKKIILICLNILIIIYLTWPIPTPPNLPQSVKSTEPGDTVQMENVSAYFTDLERPEVIDFYIKNYQSKHPLAFKINHPPERAKQIFVGTIQSYYLEEIVIPFKQSLFINGFDWQKDVFTKDDKKEANKMFVNDQEYRVKVTLKTFTSSNLFISYLLILSIQLLILKSFPVYKNLFKKS